MHTVDAAWPLQVLIHAATGGVGLVAVQYAQRLGAEAVVVKAPEVLPSGALLRASLKTL